MKIAIEQISSCSSLCFQRIIVTQKYAIFSLCKDYIVFFRAILTSYLVKSSVAHHNKGACACKSPVICLRVI